jgi:hypothetical protein
MVNRLLRVSDVSAIEIELGQSTTLFISLQYSIGFEEEQLELNGPLTKAFPH